MPTIPSRRTPLAPEPTATRTHPWRFTLGDTIYALGHPASFTVVGGELWLGCPHLHAVDIDGRTWRLPQLHCASRPPHTLATH